MLVSREMLDARERVFLAPQAQLSAQTRGRVHDEPPAQWRTDYQRDRDRVIHSRPFRRLEYKTQVFLNGSGDHLRTRLTHTMEVAGIARNIARALRLNEDLTEAIALAHDLGHSPFGHKGEHALDRLMKDHGGFEHNRQSLRIVEILEQKYPGFPGLNLTWEVREGLSKHAAMPTAAGLPEGFKHRQPSLEAQAADLADEIAYYSHDLDDGLDCGLLCEQRLRNEVAIWDHAAREVEQSHGKLGDDCRRQFTIRTLIDAQVRDVVHTTEAAIQNARVATADDVRQHPRPLVTYSPERGRMNRDLRRYLYRNLYYNPVVHGPNQRAVRMLRELFSHLLDHPRDAGEGARRRARKDGWPRALCDYIAGMTDRFCMDEHARLVRRKPAPPE